MRRGHAVLVPGTVQRVLGLPALVSEGSLTDDRRVTQPIIASHTDPAAGDGADRAHLLQAERVRKVYRTGAGEVCALRDVSLQIDEGEFVAVMGPSGSGKTTLLNCLSGLDDIDAGRVLLDGASLHELSDAARTRNRAESMGFVFQQFNLIAVLTAVENVEIPLLLAGVHAHEARRRATETLERVGLGHRVGHRPTELSGGEQQRVTIARALAGNPRIVWADEPTGALDSESADEVMRLMRDVHDDGVTLVLVTHDATVGAQAQRMIRMRDGEVVADRPIEHGSDGRGA
jgi:putative ABC transport system ATP-binding protein